MYKTIYKANELNLSPSYTGVYSIQFKNSKKRYIGSAASINSKSNSGNGFYGRWRKHLIQLKNNKHHSLALQNAYNKYGISNLVFTILKKCSPHECLEYEQKYINKYDSYKKGYNGRPVASNNGGIKWTLSRRKKYEMTFRKNRDLYLELILNLYSQNMSTRDISKKLKISRNQIVKIFKENNIKAKTVGQTRRKPILELDKNGNFIKEWESKTQCAKELNLNMNSIRQVLIGKSTHAKGHFFIYKS